MSNKTEDRNKQQESVENGNYTVKLPLPDDHNPKNLNIRQTKNGYFVEYKTQDNIEINGYVYSSMQKIHYSQTYPFELKEPEAIVEGDNLVIKFKQGPELVHGFSDIEVKNEENKK